MIKLRAFAAFTDYLPSEFEVSESVQTVGDLNRLLGHHYPAIGGLLRTARYAVGSDLVGHEHVLNAGDLVFLIPPSGGG